MFSKILIANRGEIAVRIIRACKEMGILTVAVFSEADREALHVSLADESYCIGPAAAGESYLNMPAILSAAVCSGAQAIHPGYGLLSENARFAQLCEECGITFIGPDAQTIAKAGDKDAARRTMQQAGVPVIPGCDAVDNAQEALCQARKIGFPLLIKARAGGGGRGIRLVQREEELENAFYSASGEAQAAFGDGGVYMEKYLYPAKHIEMQVLCDHYGNVVCLGERECSIQRKNQKLIEESPSSAIDAKTRNRMVKAAVRAAKAVDYRNAGTIEFLMDRDKNFYFMEMNTRLQVEHPVSELVTGKDIVKWQIRIAAGVELDCTQADIKVRGAAIECRINAGGVGKVNFLHIPSGPWVRFDTFLYQGYEVPPFYDSMLGKMIVFSSTREEAIRKMQSALCELVIGGLPNNIEDQIDIIRDPVFHSGDYYTDFIKNREG